MGMKKERILKILKDSMENSKIVALHTNKRIPNSFSAGIVAKYTKEEVILKGIDYYGEYDGYIARKINSIFNTEIDTKYNNTLYKLYNLKEQKHDKIKLDKNYQDSIFRELLEEAKNKGLVVYIKEKSRKEYNALVEKMNDKIVYFNKITQDGKNINKFECNIEDILKINCDTKDEQCIRLLNQANYNCEC